MRYLLTLGDLMASGVTNAWSCSECGRVWLDLAGPSLAAPITDGFDPKCRHPRIIRAMVSRPE